MKILDIKYISIYLDIKYISIYLDIKYISKIFIHLDVYLDPIH